MRMRRGSINKETQKEFHHLKITGPSVTHALEANRILTAKVPTYVSRCGLAEGPRFESASALLSPSSKVVICGHRLVTLSLTIMKH